MLQHAATCYSATATGLVSGEGDMKMEKGPEGQQMFVLWRPPYNDGLLDVPSNREPKWWFPNHLLGPGKSPMMGSDNPVISVSICLQNYQEFIIVKDGSGWFKIFFGGLDV